MWNLHVTPSKVPDYCLESCFLLTGNYFLFSFLLSPKKEQKKIGWRVKQQLGKMGWKKMPVYEPAWHSYISFHVSSRSLLFELYWQWVCVGVCVFMVTFTLGFDASDLERWLILELFPDCAQLKLKKKLWCCFVACLFLILFRKRTLLGSLFIEFRRQLCVLACCCLPGEQRAKQPGANNKPEP